MRGLVLPMTKDEVNAFVDFINKHDELFSETCKPIRDKLQFIIAFSTRRDQELPDCFSCYEKLGIETNPRWNG